MLAFVLHLIVSLLLGFKFALHSYARPRNVRRQQLPTRRFVQKVHKRRGAAGRKPYGFRTRMIKYHGQERLEVSCVDRFKLSPKRISMPSCDGHSRGKSKPDSKKDWGHGAFPQRPRSLSWPCRRSCLSLSKQFRETVRGRRV